VRHHARYAAALFLVALALRPQIVGIGPLIPEIQSDLGISHAVAGLLGSIPVLCMGVFAPAAAYVAGRIGARLAIAASVALIAVGGLLRIAVPDAVVLIALTFPVGIGMGIGNALMPGAVKVPFRRRPALGTGTYTTGIQLGAAIAAAVAVPLATLYGGWRASLGILSAAAGLSCVAWLVLSERDDRPAPARPPKLPLRSGTAWAVTAVFTMIAISFYGLAAWLPDAYVEHGWSEGSAGALLAVVQACAVPAGVVAPLLADHWGSRRAYLASAAALQMIGLIAVQIAPGAGWLWAVLLGVAIGTLFPLVMTLPLDLSRDAAQAGAVAGLMLGAGYSITAAAPLVLGVVRDATGSFSASLWLIVVIDACLLLSSLWLTHERLRAHAPAGEPAVS
jgi:MFS transporter, CP family, cyanate transporter